MTDISVVVPTYNEAENVAVLVERLLALDPAVDVVIVDDHSPDGTGDIAAGMAEREPRLHVIDRAGPRGYGRASVDGLEWALSHGSGLVCTMDADLSHDPDSLPALIRRAEAGADVVIGSRYVDGGELVVDWGPVRRAVSRSGSGYARMMIGAPVRDCTSGFRCYRREALEGIPLREIRSDGYCFLIELLALLTDGGAKVAEVPISYVDRRHGTSKISKRIVLEALWRTTVLGVRRVGRRSRAAGGE